MITQSKRKVIVFFDFIYNLFITKFEIIKKYLNDNFEKKLPYFFCRLQTHLLCLSKKRKSTIVRKL